MMCGACGQYRGMSARPGSRLPADEQQAELVERLRAACGAPVSFQELRADGIEHPAILSYELELVGMPVARPHRWKAPGRFAAAGLRIEESDAAPTLELGTPAHARPRFAGAAHRAALVATSALIMALAAGTTLVLVDGPSAPRVSVASARARAERSVVSHARPRPAARTSAVPSVVARAPSAGASAAQLQAEGHQLLGEARYAAAIGDLRAALAALPRRMRAFWRRAPAVWTGARAGNQRGSR